MFVAIGGSPLADADDVAADGGTDRADIGVYAVWVGKSGCGNRRLHIRKPGLGHFPFGYGKSPFCRGNQIQITTGRLFGKSPGLEHEFDGEAAVSRIDCSLRIFCGVIYDTQPVRIPEMPEYGYRIICFYRSGDSLREGNQTIRIISPVSI